MKRGPAGAELGIASCAACHHDTMRVANNKHGFPCAMCHRCRTQFAPRGEDGSLKLLGRIHTWTNPQAAELMLGPDDRDGLAPRGLAKAATLPPHLARPETGSKAKQSSTPSSTPRPSSPALATETPAPSPPAPAKRKTWRDLLDEPL